MPQEQGKMLIFGAEGKRGKQAATAHNDYKRILDFWQIWHTENLFIVRYIYCDLRLMGEKISTYKFLQVICVFVPVQLEVCPIRAAGFTKQKHI